MSYHQQAQPLGADGWQQFRMASYNACSCIRPGRLDVIGGAFKNFAVLGVQGNRFRDDRGGLPKVVLGLKHVEFRFGWSPSPFVNRSCGGSIFLSRDVFGDVPRIRQVLQPTPVLRGRVGGIEMAGGSRWLFFFVYSPPKPRSAAEEQPYAKACHAIGEWMCANVASRATAVCRVFGFFDLNDQFSEEGEGVGDDELLGKEGLPAFIVKGFLECSGCKMASTYVKIGPTFFGQFGDTKIDHICTPGDLDVSACSRLERIGFIVQLSDKCIQWEHYPIFIRFHAVPPYHSGKKKKESRYSENCIA